MSQHLIPAAPSVHIFAQKQEICILLQNIRS